MAKVYMVIALDTEEASFEEAVDALKEASVEITGADYGLGDAPVLYDPSEIDYFQNLSDVKL